MERFFGIAVIIELADELGDRWRCFARGGAGGKSGLRIAGREASIPRATRLVTPGGRSWDACVSLHAGNSATDSATENKPPVRCASVAI